MARHIASTEHQGKALLDGLDIAGALVTADAVHSCAETARYLVEDKNADYMLTVKVNRKTLHAAALEAAREAPALEALIGSFGSYPAMASSMIAASVTGSDPQRPCGHPAARPREGQATLRSRRERAFLLRRERRRTTPKIR